MVSFESDYIAGAHPDVLKALADTNLEQLPGYGTDRYCDSAKEKICAACECPDADVEFLVGGTQTNTVVISTLLKDYEGVIAADTGHIATHEAGAIERSGHKIIALPHLSGKLEAKTVKEWVDRFYADGNHEHMVFPGMVYISHPTEYGTLYSKAELEELSAVCRRYDMPLFLDGARLAYGLASKETDVTLPDIARLCDVFYIGGTKCGALCGEAVVFTKHNKPEHFVPLIKQRGALLAKGRLLGVQFDALFTDDLYFRIGEYAIEKAEELKAIFEKHRIEIYLPSPTNQQFIILSKERAEKLQDTVSVSFWEELSETHTIFRLATSWSTTEEDLKALDNALSDLVK